MDEPPLNVAQTVGSATTHQQLNNDDEQNQQETLSIDPLSMGIVNRIASNSVLEGGFTFSGGLLLQGHLMGSGVIQGHLVVWHDAVIEGSWRITGNLYVFGTVGTIQQTEETALAIEKNKTSVNKQEDEQVSELICYATAFITQTAICHSAIAANRLRLYDGAQIRGNFRTIGLT